MARAKLPRIVGAEQVTPEEARTVTAVTTGATADAVVIPDATSAPRPLPQRQLGNPRVAVPGETAHGVTARPALPKPRVPNGGQPSQGTVTGVAPILPLAAVMAFQVAQSPIGTPVTVTIVEPPPTPLARSRC